MAMMYSFFATCREHDFNPREWPREVLVRVGHTRPTQMVELLPAQWERKKEEV